MRLASLALVSVAAIGCGGSWTIVKQGNPNPLKPESTFAVAPATWDGVKVGKKTEADWLAGKDEAGKASHANDKLAFSAQLAAGVAKHAKALKVVPEGAQFTIKPNVFWFEPGYYIGISGGPAEVKVRLDVVDAQGQTVDTIEVAGRGPAAEPFNPIPRATVGQRLQKAADEAGDRIAAYLRTRAGVK